jgi:FkbM family methyltransferase
MSAPIATVRVSDSDTTGWTSRWPLMMRLAQGWARWAPRARSALPRFVGRRFGRNWRVELVQPGGAHLAVEPSSLDVYLQIAATGAWDEDVLRTCRSLLAPGQVFYDIGANVGFMSIATAAHFGGAIRVVAFEPQPELALAVARSAKLSKLETVEVICAMLGNQPGEGDLFVGSHSIHASAVAREEGSRVLHCPVYSLDRLVTDGAIPPPDVIKIDVEGAEMLVFEGARDILRRHRPAIVFEADENLARFGLEPNDLMDFLRGTAGYRIYGIADGPLRLVDAADSANAELRNFVALAPDAPVPQLG